MAIKFNYEAIRDKREELRLLPIDVANEVNISLSIYRLIENGIVNEQNIIEKVCDILDLNYSDIIQITKETKVLSIFNSKGGIGKTSSTNSLAAAFAEKDYKVLCVDLDSQCNLTQSFNLSPEELHKNIMNLFLIKNLGEVMAEDIIINTKYKNIDIITGSPEMDNLSERILLQSNREVILFEAFCNLIKDNKYDFILFDNSPATNIALLNSIYTCNYALAPLVVGERFSLDGLSKLFDTVNKCTYNNRMLKDLKIFINKYDKRVDMIDNFLELVYKNYSDNMFKTIIRIDAKLEKSQKYRKTVFDYCKNTKAIQDFRNLRDEIIALD